MVAEGKHQRQLTLAELCQAIADGKIPYTMSDGHYELHAADVRRLTRPRVAPCAPDDIPTELLHDPAGQQLDASV
jgi:hypothetical protein